jgi:hypothetical protein
MQDFMGKDGFSWFVGVVEDRNDPDKVGRVRVRVLGRHNEDLTQIKTTDLPWAHVMHPVTDPSMQGLGHTPSFLTEGSWVVGFFRDTEAQQPVIMGTLPGISQSKADNTEGFNDPRGPGSVQPEYGAITPKYGPYPGTRKSGQGVGETDTNRLALGIVSETHSSLINRRYQRLRGDPASILQVDDDVSETTGVPIATKPYLTTISTQAIKETRGFWEEPLPKSIKAEGVTKTREVETEEQDDVYDEEYQEYKSAVYPFNHVFESESGHITEVDDSPGAERMYRQHKAGTFEEIHPDGTMVTKVIGNNYEIVIGSEKIVIKGSQNITVEGSVRELIKGDYIQEIEGDFYQKIHKNHRVKVGAGGSGNLEEEIIGNHGYNIKEEVNGRIGGDVVTSSEGSKWELISGMYTLAVEAIKVPSNPSGSGIFITTPSDYILSTSGELSIISSDIMSLKSGGAFDIKSVGNVTIAAEFGNMAITTSGDLSQIVGTAWTSTTGQIWSHTSIGSTIHTSTTGNVNVSTPLGVIELN